MCGVEPVTVNVTQLALLIHGGYGANQQVTVDVCWCGPRVVAVEATNPRSVPAVE